MNKLVCLMSLFAVQHVTTATCIASIAPDGNGSAFVWTMSIKNSTPHTLQISGNDCAAGLSSIAAGATNTYTGTICYNNGGSISTTSCMATDTATGQSVKLMATYNSCSDIVPQATTDQTPSSLYPFTCAQSYTPGDQYTNSSCGSHIWTSAQTTFYDVYYFPTYSLTWNNIVANLAKGQTMATKLANSLKNALQYHESTATYSQDSQQLKITLTKGSADNPYANKTPSQCNDMQTTS